MNCPRILIVCHFFAPSSATGALRSTRLARFLAREGTPPVVVTAAPAAYGAEVLGDSSARRRFDVHEVPWPPARARLRQRGRFGRALTNLAVFMEYRSTIESALRAAPAPDFLYLCGNPFWYFPLGRYFLWHHGIPYVLDCEDLFYTGNVRYRMAHRGGVRRHLDRAAEAFAAGGAALMVLTTPEQTDVCMRRYPGFGESRFLTVPWGYDAELMGRLGPAARPRRDAFRLAIFGKFAAYGLSDARTLARACAALHDERPLEVLHLGAPEPAARRAFDEEGVGGLYRELGMLPYTEGAQVLRSADCLVLNAISDVSLPAKTYDYVYLNKPILALVSDTSSLARLLSRFPGARVASTPQAACAALQEIAADGIAELARNLDASEFSQEHGFRLLLDGLRALMADGAGLRAGV